MSDYNDGLLPEPCLRMDTHFGDEYESVEFGDGTGYVKAAPMLARLGALHVELDELRDENAKLRDSLKALMMGTNVELCADRDASQCQKCSMALDEHSCAMSNAILLLGIDMYGEPLGGE